jgi:hypothetical protein
MKPKKLSLNKRTIAHLGSSGMVEVRGGGRPTDWCPTYPNLCESIEYCIISDECPPTFTCPTTG